MEPGFYVDVRHRRSPILPTCFRPSPPVKESSFLAVPSICSTTTRLSSLGYLFSRPKLASHRSQSNLITDKSPFIALDPILSLTKDLSSPRLQFNRHSLASNRSRSNQITGKRPFIALDPILSFTKDLLSARLQFNRHPLALNRSRSNLIRQNPIYSQKRQPNAIDCNLITSFLDFIALHGQNGKRAHGIGYPESLGNLF